jgi:hypothetical protein
MIDLKFKNDLKTITQTIGFKDLCAELGSLTYKFVQDAAGIAERHGVQLKTDPVFEIMSTNQGEKHDSGEQKVRSPRGRTKKSKRVAK